MSTTRSGLLPGIAALMIAAAVAGSANPAYAEDPSPSPSPSPRAAAESTDLAVDVPLRKVLLNGQKPVRVDLRNAGAVDAKDVVLTVDWSDLTGVTAISDFGGSSCADVSERVFACKLPDVKAGSTQSELPFFLAAGGAQPGDAGSFTVTVATATPDTDARNNTLTVPVNVVDDELDLVVLAREFEPVPPGGTGQVRFFAGNFGKAAVSDATFVVTLPAQHVTFAGVERECTFSADKLKAVCELPEDVVLNPGDSLDAGIEVKVAQAAPASQVLGTGTLTTTVGGTVPTERVRGSGERSLVAEPGTARSTMALAQDADPTDNVASFQVRTAAHRVDLHVDEASASGKVGDQVKATLKVTNRGPSDAAGGFTLKIVAPTGTEIVTAPQGCTAVTAGKEYTCTVSGNLASGAATSSELQLKITSATVTAGKLTVSSAIAEGNPADNEAPIKVKVTAGAGGSSGALPTTGAQLGLVAGAGLALLVIGGALVLLGRRRRANLHDPGSIDGAMTPSMDPGS